MKLPQQAELSKPTQGNTTSAASRKFWRWAKDEETGMRTLYIDGVIAEESWFDDDITPKAFKAELNAGDGDIVYGLIRPAETVSRQARFTQCS